jgi:hypothetical protein
MRNGSAYRRPTSARPTSAGASSSSPGLPTPRARDWKNGGKDGLDESLRLLKTPTSQLAVNGGSQHPDKRKAGGHGPTLADEVEHLLPTPRASDTGTPGRRASEGFRPPLSQVVLPLLPTPSATPYGNNQSASEGAAVRPSLDSLAPKLPPTPRATDGSKGGPNQRGSSGDLTLPSAAHRIGAPSSPRSAGGNWFSTDLLPGQLTIEDA